MSIKVPNYKRLGVITVEELKKLNLIPPDDRLRKGPVAIAECPEEIPCNICVDVCPHKAISMKTINDIPRIDWDKCTGCGVCVAICPGLAIFVVDLSKPEKAYITLPYEFLPVPKTGDKVLLLNRYGEHVGEGRVVKVVEYNKTWAITVEVPKELAMEVRAIWLKR